MAMREGNGCGQYLLQGSWTNVGDCGEAGDRLESYGIDREELKRFLAAGKETLALAESFGRKGIFLFRYPSLSESINEAEAILDVWE